jgi:hypothetical protein
MGRTRIRAENLTSNNEVMGRTRIRDVPTYTWTDVWPKWIKGPFLIIFYCLIEVQWPLTLLLRNELYCSLLFCLQLDGPLSLFGSAN